MAYGFNFEDTWQGYQNFGDLPEDNESFATSSGISSTNSNTNTNRQSTTQKHQDYVEAVGYKPQSVESEDANAYLNALGRNRPMLNPDEIARKEKMFARQRAAGDLGYWLGVMGTNAVTNTEQGSATAPVAQYKPDSLYVQAMKDYIGALPNYQKYLNKQNIANANGEARLLQQALRDKNAALRQEAKEKTDASKFYASNLFKANTDYAKGNAYSETGSNSNSHTTQSTTSVGDKHNWGREFHQGDKSAEMSKPSSFTPFIVPNKAENGGGVRTVGAFQWKDKNDFKDLLTQLYQFSPNEYKNVFELAIKDASKINPYMAESMKQYAAQLGGKSPADLTPEQINALSILMTPTLNANYQTMHPNLKFYMNGLQFVELDGNGKATGNVYPYSDWKNAVLNKQYKISGTNDVLDPTFGYDVDLKVISSPTAQQMMNWQQFIKDNSSNLGNTIILNQANQQDNK